MKNLTFVFLSMCLFLGFSFQPEKDTRIVVIDAGHGGKDVGAVFESYNESEIVQTIAKKIKTQNKNTAVQIVLLRNGDQFLSLAERVKKINSISPDLVISLHINYGEETKKGFEAYVSKNNKFQKQSVKIANLVMASFSAEQKNATLKYANFQILHTVNCPSVLLELAFLSNQADRNYITSEKGQNEIAQMIVEALSN